MKDPLERTKVVVRHLPPAIAQSVLMEQIDARFAGRYKWACFHPGKSCQKSQRYSRIYIDFNRPEEVVEFAEFFDGHVFVNEKGTQFKATVEYAPCQRVPKTWNKKDGREGSISKDPEYLEFLELLAKPVENLPSAEIQLEKREAERAGGVKEAPIVTPLMFFVRQRRAAKSASQRASANVKLSRRAGNNTSSPGSGSSSSKRGSEKRRASTSMYVLRDGPKNVSGKDKAVLILASGKHQKQPLERAAGNGKEVLDSKTELGSTEVLSGGSGISNSSKKKIVLLKGKEREASPASDATSQHHSVATSPSSSSSFKQIPRHGAGSVLIRNVLSKESTNLEKAHIHNADRERRPPRPPSIRALSKDRISHIPDGDRRVVDDKLLGNDAQFSVSSDKQDKRARSKDRHDRSFWAPLRRSDGFHPRGESPSLSLQVLADPMERASVTQQTSGTGKVLEEDKGLQNTNSPGRGGSASYHDGSSTHGEMKSDSSGFTKNLESRTSSGRGIFSISENGVHRYSGRRGGKESDGSGSLPEGGNHSKRGMPGFGSHERQVWVQKTGSG